MDAVGIAAAEKKDLGGRAVSPRKGAARSYVTGGMSREAAQELGGWKSPEATGPEMRASVVRASLRLEMEFLKDLQLVPTLVDEGEIGPSH